MDAKILTMQINGGDTTIKISLVGFDTTDKHTMHGLHVRPSGDLTLGCNCPQYFRHSHDLGNIMEDDEGRVETTITDDQVSLYGNSVMNKSIVVINIYEIFLHGVIKLYP